MAAKGKTPGTYNIVAGSFTWLFVNSGRSTDLVPWEQTHVLYVKPLNARQQTTKGNEKLHHHHHH